MVVRGLPLRGEQSLRGWLTELVGFEEASKGMGFGVLPKKSGLHSGAGQ